MITINLNKRVAIVTGAGRGIGKECARALAARGARLVIADINAAAAAQAAAEIVESGGEARSCQVDVSDEKSTLAMVEMTAAAFGTVDILVNNAALFAGLHNQFFTELDLAEWDRVMAVNLRGVFLCCRAVFPLMKSQKKGKIINFSSNTVLEGLPNLLHYVTSKAGVIGLTRALAREVGPFGINVNAILPGLTLTEGSKQDLSLERFQYVASRSALGKMQYPNDLTGTVLFLASDLSDLIIGQCIVVDGGNQLN